MNTRIIATIGPSSWDYNVLKSLIRNGTDIVRLNFSHADIKQLVDLKKNLKKIKQETGRQALIMQDLQGPRLRIGQLD